MPTQNFKHGGAEMHSEDGNENGAASEIESLWADEAERRYQEFLDGKVEAVPGEKALKRIRAALKMTTDPLERSHGHHD